MWQCTFNGVFDTSFEGHATHAAIGASANQLYQNAVIFSDVHQFDITTIGLQMRPDGFDGGEDGAGFPGLSRMAKRRIAFDGAANG